MGQREEVPQAIVREVKLIYDALAQVMSEQMARASKEGVPADTFLQGTMSALVNYSAFTACNMLSPENDPHSEEVVARTHRLRVAFSDALDRIMHSELEEGGQKRGHA